MLRAVLAWCVMVTGALLAPGRALAQSFQLNAILVAMPDDGGDPGLKAAGASLHSDLEQMLSSQYLLVPFAKVPDYQDYSASVYLSSCPRGDYIGCTFVLGQRAKADWVVAIQLSKDVGSDQALFSIVDVKEARPVVSFSSKVTDGNHGAVAAGLSLVLDSVIRGSAEQNDIRGQVEDPKAAWERRQEEAKKAAQDLAFSDQALQILVRPDVGKYDQPKLRASDLADYSEREDASPWQKLGMSKSEYVQYKNSGKSLDAFRQIASGRKGRILVTLAGSFGAGSFRHVYDGRWILDDQTLEPLEVASGRQMEKGPSTAWRVEAAYGLMPWLEVGLGVAARTAKFDYFYQREIKGDEVPQLIAQDETYRYTPEFSVFGGYIPFPTWPVRPTGHVALSYWQGSSISRVVLVQGPPEDSPPPRLVMLHLEPGVEASPNAYVSVFTRFDAEILLAGSRNWASHQGDTALTDPSTPDKLGVGGGWEITLGVTAHLGPFFGSQVKKPQPALED